MNLDIDKPNSLRGAVTNNSINRSNESCGIAVLTALKQVSKPIIPFLAYSNSTILLSACCGRWCEARNNEVTFGELFSYGFKATTMIVLIFVAFLFVLSFITPEIKQKVLEATQLELEKQKNVTDEQIKTLTDGVNKYFWVILIGTTMFFFVLIGCIGSLLGAAITKKQPKNPFEQTSI